MKSMIEENQSVCMRVPRRTLGLRSLGCMLSLFLVSTAYGSGSVTHGEGATLISFVSASVTSKLPTPTARSTAAISYESPTTTTSTTTTTTITTLTTVTTTTSPTSTTATLKTSTTTMSTSTTTMHPICGAGETVINDAITSGVSGTSTSKILSYVADTNPMTDFRTAPGGIAINSHCGVTKCQSNSGTCGSPALPVLVDTYNAATNTLTISSISACSDAGGTIINIVYCGKP